jgi:hypothetical protein
MKIFPFGVSQELLLLRQYAVFLHVSSIQPTCMDLVINNETRSLSEQQIKLSVSSWTTTI